MALKHWAWVAVVWMAQPLAAATAIQTTAADFNLGSGDGQVEVTSVGDGEVHLMHAAGALGAWSNASPLPDSMTANCGWAQGNRIVLAGGANSGGALTAVISADVVAGVLGSWTTRSSLPAPSLGGAVARWGDFLYMAQANPSPTTNSSTVWMCQLDATGLPGTWTTVTSLPMIDSGPSILADYGRLYYLQAAGYSNQVYSAPILTDGTLGPWILESSQRVEALAYYWTANAMGAFFSLGGETSADSWAGESVVDRAPLSTAGVLGNFVAQASLPQPRAYSSHAQVGLAGHLYVVGGKTSVTNVAHNTVYSAPLSAGAVLGSWSTEISLPLPLYRGSLFKAGASLYYLGGDDSTTGYYNNIYQASLNQGSANCAQGVYVNRFDLGSDQALSSLSWTIQPAAGGTLQARWSTAAGSYGAWSSPNGSGSLNLAGNTARYLEYRVLLADVPGNDVYLQSVTLDAPTPTPTPTSTPAPTHTPTLTPTATPALSNIPGDPGDPVVYPNPARGGDIHFGFRSDRAGHCTLRVWNAAGQLASTAANLLVAGKQVVDLNIGSYAPGVYLFQMELDYDNGGVVNGPVKRFAIIK